jgi:hypothetical protein
MDGKMTKLMIERVDVWAASIQDKPGGLAAMLTGLGEAGADLDFIVARRAPDKPGTGVVFLTPLCGDRVIDAAAFLGFNVMSTVQSVRVEGENKPGVTADLTNKLAAAGINLRGLSGAVIGSRFILFIGFDNAEDAAKAVDVLQQA